MFPPPARNASNISANELLAPQLFWAFVPIALNTMTQPSGRILGLDAYYNFALRVSPLICAVHGITTLFQLLRLSLSTKSLKTAFLGVAAARLQEDESSTQSDHHQDNDAGEIHHLRRNNVFRLGLFMVGALPQAILIFSSKGIPWSKACCAAFLFAFVLDEAVLYARSLAGAHRLTEYDDLLPSHFFSPRRPRLGLSGSMNELLVYFYSLLFAMLIVAQSHDMVVNTVVSLISAFMLAVFTTMNHCFHGSPFPPGAVATFFSITEAIISESGPTRDNFVGYLAGFLLLALLFGLLEKKYLTLTKRSAARFPLATFVIMNHVGHFLILLDIRYDSRDTYKPYWTNWLG